jgi:hypothetical protein
MVRVTGYANGSGVEYFEQVFNQCGKIVEVLMGESEVIVEFIDAVCLFVYNVIEWREKGHIAERKDINGARLHTQDWAMSSRGCILEF